MIKVRPVTGPEAARHVVKKWTENLPCPLTPEELWEQSRESCRLNVDYQRLEIEKKAEMKRYSDALKHTRKEMDQAARMVISGQEERNVEIQEIYDIAEDVVYRIRTDTGEVLGKRNPSTDERQTGFEFGATS